MLRVFLLVSFLLTTFFSFSQEMEWLTYYEKSNFTKTPSYKETIVYAKHLAEASSIISYSSFGTSPQGRELPLLIINNSGLSNVDDIKKQDKAVMLIQACIHAGESDGKDAGLMLLRNMIINGQQLDLLDHVVLLFVPIFNVDGHEKFGPYNRINQNGPEEMGWRATAQRLNLNRDYLKADSPEMQAMIRLYQKWLPDFYIDCHVTDGADYVYPLTYGIQMNGNLSEGQSDWLKNDYLPYVKSNMKKSGNPIAPYMDFVRWHDPKSGIRAYFEGPRYSGGYAAINNRPALLIETHMLKDYKTRVTATYEMLINSIKMISANKDQLKKINQDADHVISDLSTNNSDYVLSYKNVESDDKFKYEGYKYTVEKSDLSGGDWYQYSDTPAIYEIPYYKIEDDVKIQVPTAYIVPVELTEIIDKLSLHGVKYQSISNDTIVDVGTYSFENISWKPKSFEGRVMLDYELIPTQKTMTFSRGSKIVYLNQRSAQLAIHMLEPKAPDALVRWGFLNGIFEQKEYAESYVMEKMAREMLVKDPELRKEFEEKKKNDNEFASSSYAILNWFYQKSPYWDKNIAVYPIGRIMNN